MFGYEAKIPIFFDEIKIRTRPEHSLTPKTKLELTLSKHENILLNSMTKTREKWESLVLNRAYFWIVWRCHDIWFFLFRTKCRKEQLDEDGLRHCYGIFFFKVSFWKLLDHNYVLSSLRCTLTAAIDRNLTVEDFFGHWSTHVLILSWVNIMESKSTIVPGKYQ